MFLTGVGNHDASNSHGDAWNDLNEDLKKLNEESWGGWDVALVTPQSVKSFLLQNALLILHSPHNNAVYSSLVDLRSKIESEPYIAIQEKDELFQVLESINFPLNQLPNDILVTIMTYLSDQGLHAIGSVNSKIMILAKNVGVLKQLNREAKLESLLKILIEKCSEGIEIEESCKEAAANILAQSQLISKGGKEKTELLVKGLWELLKKLNIMQVLGKFPEFYEYKSILKILFQTWPIHQYLTAGLQIGDQYLLHDQYLFSFLYALKKGYIEPEKVDLQISCNRKEGLESAFVDAIRSNTSLRELQFNVVSGCNGLECFNEMLLSVNDHQFIEVIELTADKAVVEKVQSFIMDDLDACEVSGCGRKYPKKRFDFQKIGTYINLVLDSPIKVKNNGDLNSNERECFSNYQFESCFSEEKQETFKNLVKAAKNAPYEEREKAFKDAVCVLFKDILQHEIYAVALLVLLRTYDGDLYKEIAASLPDDVFDEYYRAL